MPSKSETKVKAIKPTKKATEAVVETVEANSNFVRKAAYVYIGAIAQSFSVVESFLNKLKEDREAVVSDLAKSGEAFSATYQDKLKARAETLKTSFSNSKSEEETSEAA